VENKCEVDIDVAMGAASVGDHSTNRDDRIACVGKQEHREAQNKMSMDARRT